MPKPRVCRQHLRRFASKIQAIGKKAIAVSTFIIATEPLGERAKELIRNNMAVCDNRHVLDYYRLSADGRLLFGGKDNEFIDDPARMTEFVRQDMLKVFPSLPMSKSNIHGAVNATSPPTSPPTSADSRLLFTMPKAIPDTAWQLPA